jgi:hypothetical protein
MIDLSLLTDGGVGWLDASGPASHLVLSTRIRLARNLADHVFLTRNSEPDREEILALVHRAAQDTVLLRGLLRSGSIVWTAPTDSCSTSGILLARSWLA